jgi:hypothetical protein
LAGTTNPIGTGTGIGRNWVKKESEIGNSPEFSGIPLGIHNQDHTAMSLTLKIGAAGGRRAGGANRAVKN